MYTVQALNVPAGARVDFYADGVFHSTENTTPFCLFSDNGTDCFGDTLGAGSHFVSAKAVDKATGVMVDQAEIQIP